VKVAQAIGGMRLTVSAGMIIDSEISAAEQLLKYISMITLQ
jgi:hypothetical protein